MATQMTKAEYEKALKEIVYEVQEALWRSNTGVIIKLTNAYHSMSAFEIEAQIGIAQEEWPGLLARYVNRVFDANLILTHIGSVYKYEFEKEDDDDDDEFPTLKMTFSLYK